MRAIVRIASVCLAALLLAACGTASAASNLKVYAGYADNLQDAGARSNPGQFPNPWRGSGNVTFKGAGDKFDSGAIRLENRSGGEVTVDQVTVDIGAKHYDLWGTNLKVPANGSLILTQTEVTTANPPVPNFDTSEPNGTANAGQGTSDIAVIHIKLNGTTSDYRDSARILTTGGTDKGDLPGAPNESHQWQLLTAVNGGNPASRGLSPLLLFAPLAAMLLALFGFIPKLIGALLLLLLGWWLAALAARLVVGFLERLGLGAALARTGMFGFLGRPGDSSATVQRRPAWLIGQIVKWLVFLIFVDLAVQALGLTQISELMHSVILWIPNLIVALLVLFLGVLLAQFVGRILRGTAASGRVGNPAVLGRLVEYGIIGLSAVVALNQLGIGAVFVDILLAAVVAALALAAGLAFGLGGRDVAARMWRQSYRATQSEVGAARGTRELPEETSPATTTQSSRQR